ncbi:MAG: hypothetical protein IJQ55_01070 [Alphaproteobacteria bacterium]|nr:hypothetical protein [Alphaproteobacteria bacterium]
MIDGILPPFLFNTRSYEWNPSIYPHFQELVQPECMLEMMEMSMNSVVAAGRGIIIIQVI